MEILDGQTNACIKLQSSITILNGTNLKISVHESENLRKCPFRHVPRRRLRKAVLLLKGVVHRIGIRLQNAPILVQVEAKLR